MPRQFEGVEPEGWKRVGIVEDGEGGEWVVFAQPDPPAGKGGWLKVKLAKKGKGRKANAWLGWSTVEKRYAGSKDRDVLEEHMPRLLDEACDLLQRKLESVLSTHEAEAADLL